MNDITMPKLYDQVRQVIPPPDWMLFEDDIDGHSCAEAREERRGAGA